jgi:hypothetical protein
MDGMGFHDLDERMIPFEKGVRRVQKVDNETLHLLERGMVRTRQSLCYMALVSLKVMVSVVVE